MAKEKVSGQERHTPRIIIIIMALLTGLSFRFLTSSVQKKIIRSNIDAMEELALHDQNSITNSIILRWENMEGVAREMSTMEYEDFDDLLSVLKAKTMDVPSAAKMSLLDEKGSNILSNGVVEKQSYFADECEGRTERFVVRLNTEVYFRENVREVIFAAVPVDFTVEDMHFRWLLCQFPIDTLEKELKIGSYGGEGYSSVIDAEGNYIVNISRNHSFLAYDNFFRDLQDAELADGGTIADLCGRASAGSTAASAVYTLNGRESIMVVTALDIAEWFFISTVPVAVFDAQTHALTGSFMHLLMLLGVILAAVLYLVMRQRKQQTELQIAEAASRSKTEFLFNMSHDIRTPMNAILGYTDIAIKHRGDAERVEESLRKIKVAGGHLLNLINDILEMSRIEAGSLEIAEDPLDIRELIEGVEQMSSALAIDKSIDFQTEIAELQNPYVYSDELHANEVLINLISNAVKYTPEGGTIRFRAQQLNEPVNGVVNFRFEVEDNGIGMSEEFQQHLFEAFSREKTSTVSHQEGAGLGLSIVKRILDMAGGTISVNSRLNEGSVFTVDIPMRIMEQEAIEQFHAEKTAAVIPEDFSFEGKRVLLVEDNEMNREIATEILEDVGLLVDTAEDGVFAVDAVKKKGMDYYDFVLMDIQMPVMDGYAATKAIRALPGGEGLIIVALSANAFEEDVQRSISMGMNAHVAKPINVEELFTTLSEMLAD